jgi:hypothetical protein
MKRAVLAFPQTKDAEFACTDILKTLVGLRSDLQCIEKAIVALERVALARLGMDTPDARKSVSRKKPRNVPTFHKSLQ